jgi:hypothetical protein
MPWGSLPFHLYADARPSSPTCSGSHDHTYLLVLCHPLPERWREKLSSFFADVLVYEEAVDLISQGYFQGSDVLFADTRECLTASCESARELVVGYNWLAAENGKDQIDTEGNDVHAPGRVEQLLDQWVRLSRGKALVAIGKVFEGRDEILSVLQCRK